MVVVLGRVDAQGSLLETRWVRRHLVTKGSFYERLALHGDEIVCDDDFADLYSEGRGRPSVPPSVMVRAMLCATHDRTSDRESARRSRVDLDWKAAMGVGDEFEGIGATTFALMRARMVAADADGELFKRTLAKAVEPGVLKGKLTAIIDTSPVHGAGAVADTYELIRGFLRKVVRTAGDRLDDAARVAAEPFCGAKPDIDWQDPAARKAHLGELITAARRVLAEAAGIDDDAVAEPAELLRQVIGQDVELDDDFQPQLRDGVAADRVISHSDPEMRHGRKSASRRFDGHKLDVMTDEESELILGVDVRAGNAGDGEVPPRCSTRCKTSTASTSTRWWATWPTATATSAKQSRKPAPRWSPRCRRPPTRAGSPRPPSPSTSTPGPSPAPAGNTTATPPATKDHKRRPATVFLFPADVCAACPLRDQCTTANGGRQDRVGRHQARIQAARAAQPTPPPHLLRRRSKVERKIDHLQDLGMRKARYRGRRRTKLQALLAATVANFKRLVVLDVFTLTPALAA